MEDKIYVFVYGSLKNGFENHFWLEELKKGVVNGIFCFCLWFFKKRI